MGGWRIRLVFKRDSLEPNSHFTRLIPHFNSALLDSGIVGNNAIGSNHGAVSETMRGSIYTLSSPATVYSLTVYCDSPPTNQQLMTGIYSGSTGNVGNLIVQAPAQTVVDGWNAFPLTPTYLAPGILLVALP